MRHLAIAILLVSCKSAPVKRRALEPEPEPRAAIPEVPHEDPPTVAHAWVRDELESGNAERGLAVDGDRLVWARYTGEVVTTPLDGGVQTELARYGELVTIAVGNDHVYALGDGRLDAIARDGTIAKLADVSTPTTLAVDTRAVYVADDAGLRAVPLDGGTPVTLARDATQVVKIVATATDVYWAEPDAIRHVPVDGGKVDAWVAAARDLAISGGHVYWTTDAVPGVVRAGLDGAKAEVLLGNRGARLAIDATSVVVLTAVGLVVEVNGATAAVHATGQYGSLATTADMIYVGTAGKIVRFARGASKISVLAGGVPSVADLTFDAGYLYWLDAQSDADDHVMRVPRTGGVPEVVRTMRGDEDRIAVSGGRIATADYLAKTIAIDGKVVQKDVRVDDVTLDDKRVYWQDGEAIYASPLKGGKPAWMWPEGDDAMVLVIDQDYRQPGLMSLDLIGHTLVGTGNRIGGIVRIDLTWKKGKTKTPRSVIVSPEETSEGVAAGDRTLAWFPEGLMLLPEKQLLLPRGEAYELVALVADATDAYAVLDGDLYHVPLDGTAPVLLLDGLYLPRLVLTPDALFVTGSLDAIVQISR